MSDPAPAARVPQDVALFLDFDGTLVAIAERPDAVVVDPDLPGLLRRLRDRLGGAVAVVTGRAIQDVDSFLAGLDLDICGLHGLERRIAGRLSRPAGLVEIAADIGHLKSRFASDPGVLVEDKGVGVALHWRLAPQAEAEVRAAAEDLLARLGPGYRLQGGKSVLELVPAAAGKGAAIAATMAFEPYRGRMPVFIGDDRTDEDGFAAIRALGGVAIKIGDGETTAGYRLASPDALRGWLGEWVAGGPAFSDLSPSGPPRPSSLSEAPQAEPLGTARG